MGKVMVSNANQIYSGIFKFLADEKNFKTIDADCDKALSNKELLDKQSKITDQIVKADQSHQLKKGEVDKYVKKVISWNQEFKYLNIDKGISAYYGSSIEDFKLASKYLEKNTFKSLTDIAITLGEGKGKEDFGDQLKKVTKTRSSSSADANDREVEEQFSEKQYLLALKTIKEEFETIDKDKNGKSDGFLSNPEFEAAKETIVKSLAKNLETKKLTGGKKAEDIATKLLRKIVENNEEFKFLNIEEGGPGNPAYTGMSEADLDKAMEYLKSGKTFDSLVDEAMLLGPGKAAENNHIQSSQNGQSNPTTRITLDITFTA